MVKSFFITIVALLFSTCLFGQGTPEELVKKAWPNAYADFGKDLKSSPLNFIFVLDIYIIILQNQYKIEFIIIILLIISKIQKNIMKV